MTTVIASADPMTLGVDLEQDVRLVVTNTSIAVVDRASLEEAVRMRTEIAERQKVVAAFFAPLKSSAHKLHSDICARERTVLGPLDRLDATLRTAIARFKTDDDRRRQDEERRLQDQERRERDARAAEEAAALERAGHHELAAAIVEEAIATPAPTVVLPATTTGIKGLSFTRVWKWRPIGGEDPVHFARAIATVPREYLTLDVKRLDKYAAAMKDSARIAGLEFYFEDRPNRR